MLKSLIDPKKKAEVKRALDNGDFKLLQRIGKREEEWPTEPRPAHPKKDEQKIEALANELCKAIEGKNWADAERLLKLGVNPENYSWPRYEMPPLHSAITNDAPLEVITLMVENGASPDHCSSMGWTVSGWAHENLKSEEIGWTPLLLAVDEGRADVVGYLLGKGVNVEARDPNSGGMTAFQIAKSKLKNLKKNWRPTDGRAGFDDYEKIVELLRKHGAKE